MKWIKKLFRHAPPQGDNFALTSGSQSVVDTRLILNQAKFYAGLRPEERLTLFRSIYYGIPLATGAVNVLVKMTNTKPQFKSGNPDVDKRAREIWQSLNLSEANGQLVRQSLIFGYSIGESIWDNASLEMLRVVVPPSPEIRKVADKSGVIQGYIQLPDPYSFRPVAFDKRNIDPHKVIDLTRDPTDAFDYYGSSLFESAINQLEDLCKILSAQINVFMRLGKPRFQVNIPSEGLTEEQFRDRLDKAKSVFSKLADGTDLYMPSGVDVKIIGGETLGVKVADETRLVVSMILAAVGIPPALLHVTIQGSGATESYARQSIIVMQSTLDTVQDATAQAWNQSFWPMVARLEGLPVVPVMAFTRPRLLEQQLEEQARQLRFANDLQECSAGIRPPEWLAQQCGATEADDPAALAEFVASGKALSQGNGDKEPTTKGTDERAAGNKAI